MLPLHAAAWGWGSSEMHAPPSSWRCHILFSVGLAISNVNSYLHKRISQDTHLQTPLALDGVFEHTQRCAAGKS